MKFVRLFVLLIAAGAGIGAFYLVMNKEEAPVIPVVVAPVVTGTKVLVAAKDIPLGGKLTDKDLEWADWPESAVPEGVVTKDIDPSAMEMLLGRIAKARIYSGEPIRTERLINTDKGYMAALLPKGKRAIAVRVEQETSAGGFILPGDKVDVILTRKIGDGHVTSETILENIRVLAIDQTTAGEQETKTLSPQRTATLELTPAQSEVIVQSQQVGSIALALRSAEDSAEVAVVEEKKRRKDAKFVRVQENRWSIGDVQGTGVE
ncbi:Flp pilus assembly protein CpaB [Roseibium sp.]|uniref:Flp pilus assembly protein CpaB n=1 Tax=Roseibium sp. TaxID=1936156 RepID=UPI003D0FC4C0